MKQLLYVANWKMFFSYNHAQTWLDRHHESLRSFAPQKLVLCPSFDTLAYAAAYAQKNNFLLGAQDCSDYSSGAHTGQISAQSLAELGCIYCIVGHSEQRVYLPKNSHVNAILLEKLSQLAPHNITPILCVSQATAEQLEPAQEFIKKYPDKTLGIAYEPLESIGTGNVASQATIISTLKQIRLTLDMSHVIFLYGGSVTPENCALLKSIDGLDGFLIGSASTNIETLRAIIQA